MRIFHMAIKAGTKTASVTRSSENSAFSQAQKLDDPTKGVHESEIRTHGPRFLTLALLSALLLFPSLHRQGLAGYDDAVYAHEGKEMVRTGDWWNIRFNGNLNFEYPPLFLWLEASSFKLFGVNDAAAKLPSALLGFSTILVVYFLTLELTGQLWLSLFAMLVLATTQFFLKNATHAMTDVPFTFFFTLAIFLYVKGLKSERYLSLVGVPVALALLTRSVIGLLAIGIIAVHLVQTKRFKLLCSPWLILGLGFAVALPSVWYLSQYQLHGPAAFASHLRFVTSKIYVDSGAARWSSILNYPEALLKYYWPWLPFLIAGLFIEIRAMVREKDEAASLLIAWVLLVIVPFSLVQTRYPRYIMPVFPAFSILAAVALDRFIPIARRKIFFKLACLVGCLAIGLTLFFPPRARATDIRTLVPIAEANSSSSQRVIIYSYEDGRSDFLNQFLWYSSRRAELAPDLSDLAAKLTLSKDAIFIIDRQSYGKLLQYLPQDMITRRVVILGQSDNFLCFRLS
jgi:4-amino-4-deoxy-L-arabinose transferase-like glycosyltransferase